MATTSKIGQIAQIALKDYKTISKGSEGFLTDRMRRALITQAVMGIMLARYETEEERNNHTNPNVYVDAVIELEEYLDLR